MKGKRGWMRILEATIAVLIVSGAMMAVYSNQSAREDLSMAEVGKSLQDQMLSDIVENRSLRLDVLRANESADEGSIGRDSYDRLDRFFSDRVPDTFGHLLKICELGNNADFCKMDSVTFIETRDKDIFVEEVIVSSELGSGHGEEKFSPKKVKLFFWEDGELIEEGTCSDECVLGDELPGCSDSSNVLNMTCVENDDGCLEYEDGGTETCIEGFECRDGVCGCVDTCVVGEYEFICNDPWTVFRRSCEGPDVDGCFGYGVAVFDVTCPGSETCSLGICS